MDRNTFIANFTNARKSASTLRTLCRALDSYLSADATVSDRRAAASIGSNIITKGWTLSKARMAVEAAKQQCAAFAAVIVKAKSDKTEGDFMLHCEGEAAHKACDDVAQLSEKFVKGYSQIKVAQQVAKAA